MSRHGGRQAAGKGGVNPIIGEFQNSCKVNGLQDEDVIAEWSALLTKVEGELRLVNKTISSQMSKVLLRLFQRFQKLQKICFHGCYFEDPTFYGKFAQDLAKSTIAHLSFDFAPMTRDAIAPFLSAPNIDILSLRGNQCITGYDFLTGDSHEFSNSMNMFYNNLAFSTIKCIDLSGCHIGNDGAIAIANTLFFNTNLRCLNLTRNRIGDPGAAALAGALGNYVLTDQEAEIHERLLNEESKQKVSDDGSGLAKRKKGGKTPAKKAPAKPKKGQQQKTSSVRALSFDPNAPVIPAVVAKWNRCIVQEDGSKILPGNTTLTTLILDDNNITGYGLAVLDDMLKLNTKLVNFSVFANPEIEQEEAERVARKYVPAPPPIATQ